jgi:hypothetical protein
MRGKPSIPQNFATAFILTSSLSQSVVDIFTRGFKVDAKRGFRFNLAAPDLDRDQDTIELIALSISLGKPLNLSAADDAPSSLLLRPDHHSLRLPETGDYVVFNAAQVKPTYLVRFKGGIDLHSASPGDTLCDLCSREVATLWCINDSAKLCDSCDADSHSMNRILEKHKRVPIAESRGLMEFCPLHPDVHVEFYCPDCRAPVCLNCKMTGTHSKGDASSHVLVPVSKAYQEALRTSERENATVSWRIRAVDEKLATTDAKLKSVVDNAQAIEDEIMRIALAAVEEVKTMTGEKVTILESQRAELLRKREEVALLTTFLETQKAHVGPLAFLQAIDRYHNLIEDLKALADLPEDLDIEGNLSITGTFEVSAPQKKVETPREVKETSVSVSSMRQTPRGPVTPRTPVEAEEPPSRMPEFTSLRDFSQQKRNRLGAKGVQLPFQPFQGTTIIKSRNEATMLYLIFPFKVPPRTHLLFSTARDGRSIHKMHEMIDAVGATAVLVRTGDYVFGGFAPTKWVNDGKPFGDRSSSFLFSITRDAIIPHCPRVSDACHLLATPDTLTFGRYDIRLADDFDNCSSVIENSYGVGFEPGSHDATTFLAGSSLFRADVVEVWGFFKIEG